MRSRAGFVVAALERDGTIPECQASSSVSSIGLLNSPTFARGSVYGHAAHSGGSAMPIIDPDPASIGTYLVAAVLLALGTAIFLYILVREAQANRGQEQDGREVAAETGAAPGLSSAASTVAMPVALRQSTRTTRRARCQISTPKAIPRRDVAVSRTSSSVSAMR